jgi:hypothetical protein
VKSISPARYARPMAMVNVVVLVAALAVTAVLSLLLVVALARLR